MHTVPTSPLELAIVIPTLCERDNVPILLDRIAEALAGVSWEVIVVDDNSSDGTADAVWQRGIADPRVRCVKRVGRRGLASACIEGMLASPAPIYAVMDADLQHDPALLPTMLERIRSEKADLVVGSRYCDGGGIGDWDARRARLSATATWLAALVSRQPLSDPMSGFFMLRRSIFNAALPRLSGIGFKILLDIVASQPVTIRIDDLPLQFGRRLHGESKLSPGVMWEFGLMMVDKMLGRTIPVQFISFAAIGSLGAILHLGLQALLLSGMGSSFMVAHSAGVAVSLVFDYVFNNLITYGELRLRGLKWWRGLMSYALISSLGMLANVGIGVALYRQGSLWGGAALVGILVGGVWTYALTSQFTWKAARR